MEYCSKCGRNMQVVYKKWGSKGFDTQTGVRTRAFGYKVVPEMDVVGEIRCPSRWCRIRNYMWTKLVVLSSGEIINAQNSD